MTFTQQPPSDAEDPDFDFFSESFDDDGTGGEEEEDESDEEPVRRVTTVAPCRVHSARVVSPPVRGRA
jgi:hypothetical protein